MCTATTAIMIVIPDEYTKNNTLKIDQSDRTA